MTEVRRYSLHTDTTPNGGWYASMVGVIDGDYVAYSDHEAVVRENERLRAEVQWVLTDMQYKAPEQLREMLPVWFAHLHAALSASGASR